MRANQHVAIIDTRIVLVPYRPEHVARYHEWMANAELRELTASEPLTLEEEYEMQRKWQFDEDKLTFIILARNGDESDSDLTDEHIRGLPMIGDVNLFFKGAPECDDFEVEVEIMIAEQLYRRRGFASRALQLVLSYATSQDSLPPLPISKMNFVVRIGEQNHPSIELFKKLGFAITKRVEVFQEIEMRYCSDANIDPWLIGEIRGFV